MSFCRMHTWGRHAGAALLVVTLATPLASGQSDDGVVFVGDIDPAAAAATGPKLPALTPAARSGDPRQGSNPRLSLRQASAPSSVPASVLRAEYAEKVSKKIKEAEASQKKPSLLSRLVPGFGRKESAPAMTTPSPAPALPAEFSRGVQQASYTERGTYDEYSGRVGGIIDTPGARQRTGLFDSSRSSSGYSKPPRSASNQPKPLGQSKPSAPKQLAGTPAAKKLSPAEPTGDGMAFAGDMKQPTTPPGAKLPRPSLVPPSLAAESMTTRQPTPIIKSVGKEQPRLTPIEPSPIVVTNPAVMQPSKPMVRSVPKLADSKPAPQPTPAAAPQPSYPVTNPATLPTPAEAPSESVVATNPVPPTKIEQGPSPRAAGLLIEANGFAQTAATEEEFSNVVQRSRHVLAIDNSPTAVKYSRELAAWALNKRGELKADAGLDQEAMTDFDDALAMDPQLWRAVHNRGVLLAQHGAFAEAFDAFNETLDLNPKFAKAYSNRASLYVQAGDFENAMRDYASAIAHDPDLAIAHKGQGRVCHMLGRMELALRHLDAAAVLSPEDASVAVCRADLLVDMGRYAAAASGYQQAIQLDSESPAAYRNLAWLQATCPDKRFVNTHEATANAKRAIELSGAEDDISLDTLAAAQAASGDFAAAVETLRRAIAIAPAGDQEVYTERLAIYQAGRPFTSEPVAEVQQAGYDRVFK